MASISYRTILKTAFPIIVGGLSEGIINVTDTAFLGRVSEKAIGAVGTSALIYFTITLIGLGFSVGNQIIIGRRNGEKQYHKIGSFWAQGMYFMAATALLFWSLIQWSGEALLSSLLHDPEIISLSWEYLSYRSFGMLFSLLLFGFHAFFVGVAQTRAILLASVVKALLNIVLDYVLINGYFGFPEWGVKGAAIASILAEGAGLALLIGYVYFKKGYQKYQLFQWHAVDSRKIFSILKIGAPIMLQNFLSLSGWLAFFVMIEHMGTRALAIAHIIRSLYSLLIIPVFGFGSTTSTLVSNLLGEGKKEELPKLIFRVILLSLGLELMLVQVNLWFPEFVLAWFTQDVGLIEQSVSSLRLVSIAVFFLSISMILYNVISGSGNTLVALVIEMATISIYLLYCTYIILYRNSSIEAAWSSEFVYLSGLGVLSLLYLLTMNWTDKKV